MKYHLLLITISSLVFSCSKQKTDLPNMPPEPPTQPPTINKALPTISTVAVTSITETYAISGCNLSSNGKDSIQEMGICYSTGYVTTPTVLNEKIFIKKEVNTFTDTLKKLAPNTTYYVRAYAINSVGTAYGQVISFKTQYDQSLTPIKDYDGNTYQVVKIGEQYWTASNFKGEYFNDGTGIPVVVNKGVWASTNQPAMCYFNDDKKLGYGMYNYYAMRDSRIAPKGWHIPTKADIEKLLSSLTKGQEANELKYNHNWPLKDKDTLATRRNITGFSSINIGARNIYGEYSPSDFAQYWADYSYNLLIGCSAADVFIINNNKYPNVGLAIRFVKD